MGKLNREAASAEGSEEQSVERITGSLVVVSSAMKDMANSMKSITQALTGMAKGDPRKKYQKEESRSEGKPRPGATQDNKKEKTSLGAIGEGLKSLFTNPAVIAAAAAAVYALFPDVRKFVNGFVEGFYGSVKKSIGSFDDLRWEVKAAGIAIATYFGAKFISSIAGGITSLLTVARKLKALPGLLRGKLGLAVAGAAAVGGALVVDSLINSAEAAETDIPNLPKEATDKSTMERTTVPEFKAPVTAPSGGGAPSGAPGAGPTTGGDKPGDAKQTDAKEGEGKKAEAPSKFQDAVNQFTEKENAPQAVLETQSKASGGVQQASFTMPMDVSQVQNAVGQAVANKTPAPEKTNVEVRPQQKGPDVGAFFGQFNKAKEDGPSGMMGMMKGLMEQQAKESKDPNAEKILEGQNKMMGLFGQGMKGGGFNIGAMMQTAQEYSKYNPPEEEKKEEAPAPKFTADGKKVVSRNFNLGKNEVYSGDLEPKEADSGTKVLTAAEQKAQQEQAMKMMGGFMNMFGNKGGGGGGTNPLAGLTKMMKQSKGSKQRKPTNIPSPVADRKSLNVGTKFATASV